MACRRGFRPRQSAGPARTAAGSRSSPFKSGLGRVVRLTSSVRGLPKLSNLRAMMSLGLKLKSTQTAKNWSALVAATTPSRWLPVSDVLSRNGLRQRSGVVVIVWPSQNASHLLQVHTLVCTLQLLDLLL